MARLVVFGLLVYMLVPCPAGSTEFTDAVGRRIELDAPPQRIISLAPAVTETLYAIGLGAKIVAATQYCTWPEEARQLPRVGEYADPGLENILLFRPDLVIASADMNRPALVERLTELGIPVYVVYPRNINDALATIRALGELGGNSTAAEKLAEDIEVRLARLAAKLAGQNKPGVLGTVMLDPLTVAGPETFVSDIISRAGGRNLVPPGPSRYPAWNDESLLTTDPDVIIVTNHPGQPDPTLYFKRWPQLRAVQAGRIIEINADWIHRPGPRMILGIETLARALHPELDIEVPK